MEEMKCPQCGGGKLQAMGNNVYKCMYCGHVVVDKPKQSEAPISQPQPQPQPVYIQPVYQQPVQAAYQGQPMNGRLHDRNRMTAILLCFFFGWFGGHKFYLGQTGAGVLYLLLWWTCIPCFIAFIEFIMLLCKSDADFDREYNYK